VKFQGFVVIVLVVCLFRYLAEFGHGKLEALGSGWRLRSLRWTDWR
jgi:hypothetical protein